MKTKILTLAAALGLAITQSATAANYTWQGGTAASGGTGGGGTWNATISNWTNTTTATRNQTWLDGNTAIFGGTAGTVTISTGVTVATPKISIGTNSYALAGGTVAFGDSGVLDVNATNSFTFTSGATGNLTVNSTGNTASLANATPMNFNGSTTLTSFNLALAQNYNHIIVGSAAAFGNATATVKLTKGVVNLGYTDGVTLSFNAWATDLAGGTIRGRYGNSTWTGATSLSADSQLMNRNAANTSLVFSSTGTINLNSNTLNLMAGSAATGIILNGVISGAGNLATVDNKLGGSDNGNGITKLTANNTFTGTTTINVGTLSVAGTDGTINTSSGVTIGSGATLKIDNTAAANNTDRLSDTATITMNGGTLNFSNDSGAANFSETAGNLTISSGSNTVTTSQAGALNTSAITFNQLTRSVGSTVNFAGAGLGENTQNQIFFTTAPTLANGIIGGWATYNGTGFATYDATNGLNGNVTYTDIDALGGTITDGATTNVRINSLGTTGPIVLSADTTTVNTLLQNTTTAATVDTANKTLATSAILVGTGQQVLTIGAAAGDGNLTVDTVGGTLGLFNNSSNGSLTINAAIANNTSASSVATTGNVTFNGVNTYTGSTDIAGNLTIGSNSDQTLAGSVTGVGKLLKSGTGSLTLAGNNTYSGGTVLNAGTIVASSASSLGASTGSLTFAGNSTLATTANITSSRPYVLGAGATGTIAIPVSTELGLSGVVSSTGNLLKTGAGTFTLKGANTFSGSLTVKEGLLSMQNGTAITTSSNLTIGDSTGISTIPATVELAVGTAANLTYAKPIFVVGTNQVNTIKDSSYVLTLSGLITLSSANLTLDQATTAAEVVSGGITGTGNLIIANTGTGGSLTISTNSANITGTITNSGSGASTTVISAPIGSNVTALNQNNAAGLALSGNNSSYAGTTTVTQGALVLRTAASKPATGTNVLAGATLGLGVVSGNATYFDSTQVDQLFSNTLAGVTMNATSNVGLEPTAAGFTHATDIPASTFGLVKLGANTLTLSGNNSYSGGTQIVDGYLNVAHNNALGTGNVTIGIGAERLALADGVNIANNIVITGGGGGVASNGLIQNVAAGQNATVSGNILVNGAPNAGGMFASVGNSTLTLAGAITSASTNVTVRTGTVIFSGSGSSYPLLSVTGTARLGANNALATSSVAGLGTSGAGILDLAGYSQSLAGIQKIANTANIGNSANGTASTLTLTGSSSYSGIIQDSLNAGNGTVSVTVNGAGQTTTFSGANTYTGATTVTAGTLIISSTGNITSSAATVNGGTLTVNGLAGAVTVDGGTLSGNGTVGAVIVNAGGTLAPGNSPGVMSAASVSLNGTTNMELAGNGGVAGTDFDRIVSAGSTTYGGALNILSFGGYDITQTASYGLFNFGSQSGNFASVTVGVTGLTLNTGVWTGTDISGNSYSFSQIDGTLSVAAIPEPKTWALIGLGLGFTLFRMGVRARRLRRLSGRVD